VNAKCERDRGDGWQPLWHRRHREGNRRFENDRRGRVLHQANTPVIGHAGERGKSVSVRTLLILLFAGFLSIEHEDRRDGRDLGTPW
jgi:hypothetical protein